MCGWREGCFDLGEWGLLGEGLVEWEGDGLGMVDDLILFASLRWSGR